MPKRKKEFGPVRPKRYNRNIRLSISEPTSTGTCSHSIIQPESTKSPTDEHPTEFISDQTFENISNELDEDNIIQLDMLDRSNNEVPLEKLLSNILYHHSSEDTEVNDYDRSDSDCEMNNESDDDYNNTTEDIEYKETESEKNIGDDPIYYGHSMPIRVSLLLILLYSIKHSISGSQLSDLLTLIGVHCMEVHPGLKSIFNFKQHFANIKSPLRKHSFCMYCLTCVETESEICPNQLCNKNINEARTKAYFIEVPVESQIQNFFKRVNFAELITSRFKRNSNNSNNREDIYDGEIYKSMSQNGGPLSESHPYNISFTLNTDGIPIFKSSKFSIWIIYLMVNELPFKIRKQSENMIFCGLWFGESKPFMATFGRPLHASLKNLEKNGVTVTVNNEINTCKAFLICITADLPARSLLLNMNQYNGAYSCAQCLEKGSTFRTKKGESVHIFPFDRDNPYGNARTHTHSTNDAKEAGNSSSTVHGIKGPSFLMCLNSFDYVKGTSIDYMHGVLLGISKLLIKLWVSSTFSKEDFSIAHSSDIIDSRLIAIKPPSYITRIPHAISSHFKYWKASELRSWLFFYSLPILQDILPATYFVHYAAFVEAIHILCGNSISPDSLQHSERLLTYFVMTFASLYGERYQTLNLHSLLHLPECVRNLGPLWAYSCFSFESANGEITKLFHGTQHVDMQILSSVNIIQVLPEMVSSVPKQYRYLLLS